MNVLRKSNYQEKFKLSPNRFYCALAAIAVAVGIAILIWGEHSVSKSVAEDIPLVRITTIKASNTAQDYTYSGEVRGRYESPLSFQVGGRITKRYVELGSVVHAGEVLMQIDPKDVQQSVNLTSAQIYSAESRLKLAKSNLDRYQQLYREGAIGRAALEQYQSDYDVALAASRQASAQYSQSANQLDYCSLYADKSGIVSAITAETGQVVGAGQAVVTVVQDGELEVETSVPENRIDELRKAAELKITFWAIPNLTVQGKVREIAPMAAQSTRTYKVRISLLHPSPKIELGMTAAVNIADVNSHAFAVEIPLSAVYQTGDTPGVWVVTKDNNVHLCSVKLGTFSKDDVQVISGLQAGDVIVTAGVAKLREGQKVRVSGGDM